MLQPVIECEHYGKLAEQRDRIVSLYGRSSNFDKFDEEQWRDCLAIITDIRNQIKAVVQSSPVIQAFLHHDFFSSFHSVFMITDGLISRFWSNKTEIIEELRILLRHSIRVLESLEFYVEDSSLSLKPIPLQALFDDIVGFARAKYFRKYPEGISVEIKNDLVINGHEGILWVLLYNMVKNALKHGCASLITIKAYKQGDAVVIEMIDDGLGVKAEIVDRIFDYGKGKGATGSGLGLANARERLATMGGTIKLDPHGGMQQANRETSGAKFTLSFGRYLQDH